mmetsp:Transcript_36609/g.72946  ORF Transcript_36609/g.72946 Transcript_36609/m.72946 type:complete len:320 (+) Transcript_36609:1107-2066(+)
MAASFIKLARLAPEKPVVRLATMPKSSSGASGLPFACTLRIARRPLTSGRSTGTRRSKRPGRVRAESSVSARLVAASTITPELPSKPSISVRIWLSVCSRSSLPPPPMPPPPPPARAPPMASISSMKTMHGAFFFAWPKRSRTREAPTPTNISTNSEPEADTKGTPASPATARASSVLPVPGGPSMMAPLGIFAPRAEYFAGSLRKSTISVSSSLAPSQPATSTNVTPVCGSIWILDCDLPTPPGPGIPPMPPPGPPREASMFRPMRRIRGRKLISRPPKPDSSWRAGFASGGGTTANCTLCLRSSPTSSASPPGKTLT